MKITCYSGRDAQGHAAFRELDERLYPGRSGPPSLPPDSARLFCVTDGGRVLGVTALGGDIREAVDNAYRGVIKIKFDGAGYRSDIAHRALERLA